MEIVRDIEDVRDHGSRDCVRFQIEIDVTEGRRMCVSRPGDGAQDGNHGRDRALPHRSSVNGNVSSVADMPTIRVDDIADPRIADYRAVSDRELLRSRG